MLHKINIKGMQKTCVLAVRDDEPSVGDDEDTSSEAAEGMGMRGTLGDYVDGCGVVVPTQHGKPAPDVRAAGDLWGSTCCKVW